MLLNLSCRWYYLQCLNKIRVSSNWKALIGLSALFTTPHYTSPVIYWSAIMLFTRLHSQHIFLFYFFVYTANDGRSCFLCSSPELIVRVESVCTTHDCLCRTLSHSIDRIVYSHHFDIEYFFYYKSQKSSKFPLVNIISNQHSDYFQYLFLNSNQSKRVTLPAPS